ncbi:flagellar filament capping protein FliD [Bacillus sp. DNRA2]|uniref:flagellar filament capping protein FliD n=1 Tax=Bacillus sp. DNRA2 TaxID=2723053 RepID=UPI00145E9A24|nr:flagellar filament capping protein FliD [Bacillus sp. DNRA2]NMD69128.1 flagellar filament capping protein FliD [Bacillus sp. DNRA2]
MTSINNDPLRVSGLASGMNTEEIVDKLVTAQSARLNKMIASKTQATWKSDAYRDVNRKLDEFRKAMEGLRLQSTFSKQKVTSSDSKLEVSMAGISTRSDFVISSATPAASAKPAVARFDSRGANVADDTTFKLNGVEIKLTKDMTLDQAVAEINNFTTGTTPTNVRAANVGGSLVFTSLGTGATEKIEITDVSTSALNMGNRLVQGTNATLGTVTINGTTINISSNNFTYEGVAFNIKAPITSDISVQISSDTQGIYDNIKTFVDKYNELIADLNGRISEKKYRDYPPLTDEQKKDMKENDIKLWEEKAKSGLLQSDSTVSNVLVEMRNSLSTMVKNTDVSTKFDSLKEIGLNFSTNYYDNGKIIIDEAKLKGVLETNLEDVKKLFTIKDSSSTSTNSTTKDSTIHNNSGFGWRIYERLNAAISQLGELAGSPNSKVDTESFMAKQLKTLDSNISREQTRVNAYEKRLWKQFTAMESALSKMNSQSSWLSQQLGG